MDVSLSFKFAMHGLTDLGEQSLYSTKRGALFLQHDETRWTLRRQDLRYHERLGYEGSAVAYREYQTMMHHSKPRTF